jgi:undecaprenyl-diphosphatase
VKHVILLLALLAPLESLDAWVQTAVQGARRPALERPMRALTDVGKPAVLFASLLAISTFGGPAGPPTVRYVLATLAGTNLCVEGLKRTVNRPRPDGERKRSNASFPSSHAANAFAVAWALRRRWPRLAPAFLVFAAAVALSRVYLNRHFASDVVVGAALGVLWAWGMARWRHPAFAFPVREPAREPSSP